jgi:hypothetical protein
MALLRDIPFVFELNCRYSDALSTRTDIYSCIYVILSLITELTEIFS